MQILFIDLASHNSLLACVTDDMVVTSQSIDHRIDDGELIVMLEKLLREAQWTYADLTHVACVTGPGGFTSLRVAVSLANTLIHQLKIPGAGVHLSDLYFARTAPHPCPLPHAGEGGAKRRVRGEKDLLWLHSTKKHELFVRGFGDFASRWPEPIHMELSAFLAQVPNGVPWVGELIPEHEVAISKKGPVRAELKPIESVLPAFLGTLDYRKGTLEPWYGRGG